jgi:diaminohydroxyphosphoribosylaminopyrimidine deaminase/5-amino-6-(5-phosphoribosylamino)uracil reductase
MITDDSDGRVDLAQVLENLGAEKVTNVLLEGGPTVFAAAFRQKLVDKVMVYTAPKIVGDQNARAVIEGPIKHLTPIHFERITYEEIDHDILMTGHVSDQFRDLKPRDSIVKEQPTHTPATEKEALA